MQTLAKSGTLVFSAEFTALSVNDLKGFEGSYFPSVHAFRQTDLNLNGGKMTHKRHSYWCIHHRHLSHTKRRKKNRIYAAMFLWFSELCWVEQEVF